MRCLLFFTFFSSPTGHSISNVLESVWESSALAPEKDKIRTDSWSRSWQTPYAEQFFDVSWHAGGDVQDRSTFVSAVIFLLLFSHSVVSNCFANPRTVDCQAPLSVGFPRQKYWSGFPFPSPGGLLCLQMWKYRSCSRGTMNVTWECSNLFLL